VEVLLACVEAWGLERAIRESIGMFAFALWDARERSLSLVRDRAGVKPLYYAGGPKSILFGSELKALAAHPRFDRTIDAEAVALYRQYNYVPAPWSIYKAARKLEPGTILTISARGSQLLRYWNAIEQIEHSTPFKGSENDAVDAVEAILSDSVALRMIADVPLGVFLSGGVDSSLVAAIMQRQQPAPIHTFTIGFDDSRFDEAPFGRAVAEHIGSHHEEVYATALDALRVATEMPRLYDEPFADTSAIPTYLVSRMARRSVTVALSGDGGDELFGGYHHHFLGHRLERRVSSVPRPLRRPLGKTLRALGRSERVRRFGAALVDSGPVARYWNGRTPLRERMDLSDPTDEIMLLDFVTYLPDDILVKVDRASMAVSLEAREPLLDHRLAELAWSLPLRMKIRDDRGKWILKQVLRRYLPVSLIEREKHGFGLPVAEWLRGPLRDWAQSLLPRGSALLERHIAGEDLQGPLWNVLMLESWKAAQR
jgi:asparagine synthase (glutamine-hydrolysing)